MQTDTEFNPNTDICFWWPQTKRLSATCKNFYLNKHLTKITDRTIVLLKLTNRQMDSL